MGMNKFVRLYEEKGSIRAVARATGNSFRYVRGLYKAAVGAGLIEPRRACGKTRDEIKETTLVGRVKALETSEFAVPPKGRVKRYILTCAQNNTTLHAELWQNLMALSKHYDARVMVSRFVYDKRAQSAKLDKAQATGKAAAVTYSYLITSTGQLSAASLILSSKRDRSAPSRTVFVSTTLKTSGHIPSARPQEIQPSSIQTRDIVIVICFLELLVRG